MIKALVYLRVSTDKQSVERQIEDLKPFIKSKGFKENEVYYHCKVGASAYKIDEDYLELKEGMYNYLLNNPTCKTVFAWHINRLGRDEVQLQEIRQFLVKNKVQLFIKEPSLYLLNEDGTENSGMSLAFSLFSTLSRLQIDELKSKTSSAKRLNASKGKYNGGEVKIGYIVDDKGYVVPNEGSKELELVLTAFNEYSTGKWSCKTLADELSQRGYTFNGKPLYRRMLNRILKDTAYIGYTDSETERSHRSYVPIISEELFNKVKGLLNDANKVQKMESKHHYFASKLITCGECGHHWAANSTHYRCAYHFNDTKTCSNSMEIKISLMDGILTKIALSEYMDFLVKNDDSNKEKIESTISINNAKIDTFQSQFEGISKAKRKVQMGFENGIYNEEEYIEKLKGIEENAKSWQKSILSLQEQKQRLITQLESKNTTSEEFYQRILELDKEADSIVNEKELEKIVKTYIKDVQITGNSKIRLIRIWKYSDEDPQELLYLPQKHYRRLWRILGTKVVAPFYGYEIIHGKTECIKKDFKKDKYDYPKNKLFKDKLQRLKEVNELFEKSKKDGII